MAADDRASPPSGTDVDVGISPSMDAGVGVSPPTFADIAASVSPPTDAAECWLIVHNWDQLQARKGAKRMTVDTKADGPPHAPTYTCTLDIPGPGIGVFAGNGCRTIIAAKQDAALAAYKWSQKQEEKTDAPTADPQKASSASDPQTHEASLEKTAVET